MQFCQLYNISYWTLQKYYETIVFAQLHWVFLFLFHQSNSTSSSRWLQSTRWLFCHFLVHATPARPFCFRNPPNSDMDYSIFNMHIYMIILMRAYTHGRHTDSKSAHFWLRKTQVFLVLLTGFELQVIESWVQRSTNWATPSPQFLVHHQLMMPQSL